MFCLELRGVAMPNGMPQSEGGAERASGSAAIQALGFLMGDNGYRPMYLGYLGFTQFFLMFRIIETVDLCYSSSRAFN